MLPRIGITTFQINESRHDSVPVCRYNGHIMKTTQCDFLVVGSGLAGLSFALKQQIKPR